MAIPEDEQLPDVLVTHLRSWVGGWPGALPPAVFANPFIGQPSWDGTPRQMVGVVDGAGRVAIGVAPQHAEAVRDADLTDLDAVTVGLAAAIGLPEHRVFIGEMRWTVAPTGAGRLPDAGVWLPVDDPRVPPWLHPFGGDALVALEDDRYVAGVGVKRHDAFGHELAVVTDEAARGRGLARRLVAQAARRVVDEGRVATYLHAPANVASARVADAAGFPDRGWRILGLFRSDPGATTTN